MANEAVLHVQTGHPVKFTVANGTGIEKGALLQLTDPWTASAATAAGQDVAGIAGGEKIASDGNTTIDVYREGIFKVTLSGSCIAGDPLGFNKSTNHVSTISTTQSGSPILGYALETGATAETIFMEVRPGAFLGGGQFS